MEERTNEAFEFEEKLTVVGGKLLPGALAPDFELENFDPECSTMRLVSLSELAGSVRLLNIINSVDTPVCNIETVRWEQKVKDVPGLLVFTISMDLPFAMARWQKMQEVGHLQLSAHNNEKFATDYGVLLKEWRLLQRTVIVIDQDGKVVYAEYVPDQMAEPNYAAAIEAATAATGKGQTV